MRVREIDSTEYESLARDSLQSTVYHSTEFLGTLEDVLEGARLVILGLFQGERLRGGIPCFIKRFKSGSVLNSLPFYGSTGGYLFVARPSSTTDERRALLDNVVQLAESNDCLSSTIISSPMDSDDSPYGACFRPDYTVDRSAQILELPKSADDLIPLFSKKCRNSVRRAVADGVDVTWDASLKSLEEVHEGQRKIMEGLGAVPRPIGFFHAVAKNFRGGEGYRVYRAELKGETIALLLTLYHAQRTVEYSVPVVPRESRKHAPMNLIVHRVAADAVRDGFRSFSFGGTRPGQVELRRFKQSFGAVDHPYHYFVKAHRDLTSLISSHGGDLESSFKWFYVVPLQTQNENT